MNPIVLAMVICDHYYRDVNTGKSIISGTFSTINAPKFPSSHGNMAVYIAITDVAFKGNLQLTFRKEDGNFSTKLPPWNIQKPEDRRDVIEIGGNINGLPIPQEGSYEFVVSWNDIEIFSRRIQANRVELPQSNNNNDIEE